MSWDSDSDSDSDWEPEPTLNLKIVNVDKKKVLYLGDLLYTSDYACYFGILSLCVFKPLKWKSLGQLMEKERIQYRKIGVPRGLGKLEIPGELICIIFDHIDDVRTALQLGAANTRLMLIGESRIKQLMGGLNWTGDRLICVEDGGDDIDLPEGLGSGDVFGDFEHYAQPEDLRRSFDQNTPEYRIADDLGFIKTVSIQSDIIWNLTKQVYVRADAIPEDIASEHDDEFIMGWILLVHIIWTNSDEVDRGEWAGDKFELTGKDMLERRLEDSEDGRKWTDVSEKAFQFFRNSEFICLLLGLA